jgi:hypothetical protein
MIFRPFEATLTSRDFMMQLLFVKAIDRWQTWTEEDFIMPLVLALVVVSSCA